MDKKLKSKPKPPRYEDIVWTNRCYGYVRVSTKKQGQEGLSIENQKLKINSWAITYDHVVVDIMDDKGVTGTSMDKRKGLLRLLDTIKQGETFIALSFSRISRSARDFLNILHAMEIRGCRIVIMNEGLDTKTAYGRFTATMMSAVAQLEADMISKRVKDSMDLKDEKKEFVGRVPYGWKMAGGPGSGLVELPEEQAVIQRIRALRNSFTVEGKQYSYEAIARKLTEEKVKPPGKAEYWTDKQISRIYNRKEVKVNGRPPERRKGATIQREERTYSSDEEDEPKTLLSILPPGQ